MFDHLIMLKNTSFNAMKNWLIIPCLIALISIRVLSPVKKEDGYEHKEKEDHAGAKSYWANRVGVFKTDEQFILEMKRVRSKIDKIPRKKSLGLAWKELGPDNIGGRVRAILIDNLNPSLLYAGGVSGGLWYSQDAGLTWQQTEPGDLAEVLTVNCITQDEDGYVYYGTGEGVFYGNYLEEAPGTGQFGFRGKGVFRSTEPHGTVFEHLEESWIGKESNTIAVNALSSDGKGKVYAGAKNKLYRTSNRGETWDPVNTLSNSQVIYGNVYDVKTFSDGGVIMAMGYDYYMSETGDAYSFEKISGYSSVLTPASGRSVIAISPSNENVIYICRSNNKSTFDGLFRSVDRGKTWEKIIGGGSSIFKPFTGGIGQGDYNQCLAVFPNNPNKILLGGIDVYEWEEGENWKRLSTWKGSWGAPNYVHNDVHTFVFHPSNPNQYYIGTDGGIFVTKDNGKVYQRLNRGFNVTQFYSVGFDGASKVIGGTQDNSNIYIDYNGNTALNGDIHNSGDGGHVAISNLVKDAIFVESQYGRIKRDNSRTNSYSEFFYHQNAAINVYDDVDYDWSWSRFVTPICLWESNNDQLIKDSVLYIAKQDFSSDDIITVTSNISGLTFQHTLDDVLFEGDSLTIKVPSQSMFLYGTNQALYMSRNAIDFSVNPSWIELSTLGCKFDQFGSGYGITAIATSYDGNIVYYGTVRGEVYRVSNVSEVLSDETANLTTITKIASIERDGGDGYALITDIAVDPNNQEHVMITTGYYDQSTNIYVSTNAASTEGEESFVSIQGNLPSLPVYTGLIELTTGVYIIGTEYGLFSSEDGGSTWYQEFDGPPQCPVTMIRQQTFKQTENRGQIFVATHGRGLFTSENYLTTRNDSKMNKTTRLTCDVFPNPSDHFIQFDINKSSSKELIVQILDLNGRLVMLKKQKNQQLDISDLSKGHYTLLIQMDEKIYTAKFVRK